MNSESKIFVAGASGMVGSAVVRALKKNSYKNILIPSRKDLDLLSQKDTYTYINDNRPDYVIVCAAKVAEFIQIILTERSLSTKISL